MKNVLFMVCRLCFICLLSWLSVSAADASPVKNLKCNNSTNTENAELILLWTKPEGQHNGYNITESNNRIISNFISTCNSNCNYTISNLTYHTEYKLAFKTLSCGLPSTPVNVTCMTGITSRTIFFVDNIITTFNFYLLLYFCNIWERTNLIFSFSYFSADPVIPENYLSLMTVTNKQYNKFTLEISPMLLDNTNGPITYVGVLVTNNLPGELLSHLLMSESVVIMSCYRYPLVLKWPLV